MKPKLTMNCSSSVIPTRLIPGVATFCNTAMTIGIMAEARAVALAKPRWMTIRNKPNIARIAIADACLRPNWMTTRSASQVAPLVEKCTAQADADAEQHNGTPRDHGLRLLPSYDVDAQAGTEARSRPPSSCWCRRDAGCPPSPTARSGTARSPVASTPLTSWGRVPLGTVEPRPDRRAPRAFRVATSTS